LSYDYMMVKAPAGLAGTSATDENLEAVLMAIADALSGESSSGWPRPSA
jgi:hypothetical protein